MGLLLPWLQTGNHIFEVDGARSGDAVKDKIWWLLKLTKDWTSYKLHTWFGKEQTRVEEESWLPPATQVILPTTNLLPYRTAHCARPFKLK